MENIHLGLAGLLMALFLITGLFAGAALFPVHKTEIKEVAVEKEVIKEVPIEVEVEKIIEVPVESTFLEDSVEEVMKYLEDEEMLVCDSEEYDEDETSISRVYNEWGIEYDDEDYTVTGSVKLKFKESDLRSCRERFDFEVFYEEGEEAEVTIL